MMNADKSQYDDKFGRMLKAALSGRKESVRADFADDVLKRIKALNPDCNVILIHG